MAECLCCVHLLATELSYLRDLVTFPLMRSTFDVDNSQAKSGFGRC